MPLSPTPETAPLPYPDMMVRFRTPLVVFAHAVLFALALLAAFLLAFNFKWVARAADEAYLWFFDLYLPLLALALPIKLWVFSWTKQYRGSWRYVGLRDLFSVISAALTGSFLYLTAYFMLEYGWHALTGHALIDTWAVPHLPQSSVFTLDLAATIATVCAARILMRFYYEDIQPQRTAQARRVLICGAGDVGEALLRELLRTRYAHYQCVGFLDDEVASLHGRIHEVEVLGRTKDIREICQSLEVQEVLMAMPRATPKTIRELVERCEGTGVHFRTIPAVTDLIEGRVQVSRIRDVDIEDLLGREPIQLDAELIGRQLRGRRVLVTGAGGSIGSEMCRQIAAFDPHKLILLEQAENNLFEIERELRAAHPTLSITPYVADITDRARIRSILESERPAAVFHAAAHKHVPMMELNPGEAVKNNILGTRTVADACQNAGVEKMVMISTDKAINPTSIMGCTKRVAELYVQSLSGSGATQFVTVRFGNVLGSSGSVVPIFKEQIARGGPVTVTHADMTRYFMTIPEAAQLVLQAGTMGKGGEIYVLRMGEPVKIVDLARDMITLCGLRPDLDIEIVFSGKRPGEKLYEELLCVGEDLGDTSHPKIMIWKHRPSDRDAIRRAVERLIAIADQADRGQIQMELQLVVPEYTPERCEAAFPTGQSPLESVPRDTPIPFSAPS